MAEAEAEVVNQIEAILVKKDEGRPVTPEEYSVLSQFVDRIERGIIGIHQAERMAELEQIAEAKEKIPETAFDLSLEELNLSEGLTRLLNEAEYKTVGDLMLQMELDSDAILGLNGIGPKAMEKIEGSLAEVTFPEPVVEEPAKIEGETIEEAAEPEAETADRRQVQARSLAAITVSHAARTHCYKTIRHVCAPREMLPAKMLGTPGWQSSGGPQPTAGVTPRRASAFDTLATVT